MLSRYCEGELSLRFDILNWRMRAHPEGVWVGQGGPAGGGHADRHSGWSEGWAETGQEGAGLPTAHILYVLIPKGQGLMKFGSYVLGSRMVWFCVFRWWCGSPYDHSWWRLDHIQL